MFFDFFAFFTTNQHEKRRFLEVKVRGGSCGSWLIKLLAKPPDLKGGLNVAFFGPKRPMYSDFISQKHSDHGGKQRMKLRDLCALSGSVRTFKNNFSAAPRRCVMIF
jgi:hypothetical protein